MKNFSEYLEESLDAKIVKALKLPRTKEFARKTTDDIEKKLVSDFYVRTEYLPLYKLMRAPQYEWKAQQHERDIPRFTKFPAADVAKSENNPEVTCVICVVEYSNGDKDVSIMQVRLRNGTIGSWLASRRMSNPDYIKNILKVYYLPAKAVEKVKTSIKAAKTAKTTTKTGGSADIMKKIEQAEHKNALVGAFLRHAIRKYPSLSFEAALNEISHWLYDEDEYGWDIAFAAGLEFTDKDAADALRVVDELSRGSAPKTTKRFMRW